MDSSGSIDSDKWDTSLQFVVNVINQFKIGPDNVQVAFGLFSDVARVQWGLTRYRDKRNLEYAIRNVRQLKQTTNLNDALYLTRTVVFAPDRGARPGALKVTIILTDGEDNEPMVGTPLTLENATACKDEDIQLIAVGVSDLVDEDRLRLIVSDSQRDYYSVNDFNALRSFVIQLGPQSCAITTTPTTSIRSYVICSCC